MKFCFCAIVILSVLPEETRQTCATFNVYQRLLPNFGRFPGIRKYVHCENEILSPDFHAKIPPIAVESMIQWLEINNTNSPVIPAGAFQNLTVPEIRINDAGVRVIDSGAFDGLTHLKLLSLRSNKIIEVKDYYFTHLTYLEGLDLSVNNIAMISEGSFQGMKALKRLNLQSNLLSNLHVQTFKDLTKLDFLDLSFNNITQIEDGSFASLINLESLFLNNNNLVGFDAVMLSKNARLKNLNINNNYLKGISNVSFSGALTKLNLTNNLIQTLSFSKYTSVQTIDLSSNGISSIVNFSFKDLEITELYLDQNHLGLSPVPGNIFSNLSSLQSISISDNQIQKLDPNIFRNNKRLTRLNLAKNYLSSRDVLNLPGSLQDLDLSFNQFDANLNVTGLPSLKIFDVSENNFTEITFNFLKNLKWLFRVDFSNNKITKISLGCFRDLKMLREIDLSHNFISSLEVGVFVGLDGLFRLDISHNKLTHLNDGLFHNLRYLQLLDLGYNNVSYSNVDDALAHLTVLREIGLAGNEWTCNSLSSIVKQYKRIKIIDVANYDVTNVDGVACRYELNSNELIQLETDSLSTMASKLLTINVILILILIVLICKIVVKCFPSSGKDKMKSMFRRNQSEEELQLVNNC